MTTLAGSGSEGDVDGSSTNAQFDNPVGVAYSPDGTKALVAESGNHKIRAIVPTPVVCTRPTDTTGFNVTETQLTITDGLGFDVSAQCAAGHRGIASVEACTAPGPYSLGGCSEIDECLEETAGCHADATCINTAGSFTCACNDGYTGDGYNNCADVDECTAGTHNCDDNAVCVNVEGSFHCACDGLYVLSEDGTACNPTIQTAVVGLVVAVSVLAAMLFVVAIKLCKVSSAPGDNGTRP